MNENLSTMEVAKELVTLGEKHATVVDYVNYLADIVGHNAKESNKWINKLRRRSNTNTVLILGIIGYLAYKESDKVKVLVNDTIDKLKNYKSKKEAMDDISEELTDLTMNGASDEELEEAVKRSKDVIDSYK